MSIKWGNDTETLSRQGAVTGGPGLDGYVYNADVYCIDCGREIIHSIYDGCPRGMTGIEFPEAGDSETVPQPIFFGESDTEQHCAECGTYLYGEEQ